MTSRSRIQECLITAGAGGGGEKFKGFHRAAAAAAADAEAQSAIIETPTTRDTSLLYSLFTAFFLFFLPRKLFDLAPRIMRFFFSAGNQCLHLCTFLRSGSDIRRLAN